MFVNRIEIDWTKVSGDSYVREIPSIKNLDSLSFNRNITFFTGENGSGKSTLLEAMAVAYGFNPEGGTRNYHFSTRDSHSSLYEALMVYRSIHKPVWGYFLRAESFYNVATAEEMYAKGSVPSADLHKKSHGESFLAVVQEHFQEDSIYFLDEPEAALSPQRQLTLLIEISQLAKRGAQFFIVTHSPILLGMDDAQILSFDGDCIHEVSYEETDSYQVTEMFINNRAYLLKKLLNE